jgi:tetratricopeptide (TPR) repeat protein
MSDKDQLQNQEEEITEEIVEVQEESVIGAYFQQYKMYIIGAVAIIVIALGISYYQWNKNKTAVEATKAITLIIPVYQQGQFDQALNGMKNVMIGDKPILGLKEIADKYTSIEPGKQAALYAANCYIYTNKFTEAERYLKIASESSNKLVQTGANGGFGVVKEMQGKYAEAASYYQKAAETSDNDLFKSKHLLFAGLCLEKSGDKNKAIENFKQVVGTNKVSEFGKMAKSRLAVLGIIID